MKFFIMFISLLLGTTVFAETIDINWYKEDQLYQTTTCEIGNDVLLPTAPTKRGHIFKGWTVIHFHRGTFANWLQVPSSASGYGVDYSGSTYPLEGDYIIVSNASGYRNLSVANRIELLHQGDSNNIKYNYYNYNNNSVTQYTAKSGKTFGVNEELKLRVPGDGKIHIDANVDNVVYNYGVYNTGDEVFLESWTLNSTRNFYFPLDSNTLSGTWKFVYNGIWAVDGKKGWVPQEQIANE